MINMPSGSQTGAGSGGGQNEVASARKILCRHSPCLANEGSNESLIFDSLVNTGNLLLFLFNRTNKHKLLPPALGKQQCNPVLLAKSRI